MVHYVRDDGGEEAEQHDRRAGIHDRVQKLPRVWGERQHLLQILRHKKREKNWESDRSHHKYSITKIISEQELGLHSDNISDNPPKDEDDELSICIGTVYCADEICKPNTNECQGNVFELERCPNQHKRVTTLSSEYSSPCIYILHFRHLADTLSRSD